MSEGVANAFVIVASLALIAQAAMLVAVFFSLRKTSEKVEHLTTQLETRALPVLDAARTILDQTSPTLKEIAENLKDISVSAKVQMDRIDATVSDLSDRTRLQLIRVDELVSQTLDRVEETTELVQETIVQPVKQVSAVVQGLNAGINALLGNRRRRAGAPASEEEGMFI